MTITEATPLHEVLQQIPDALSIISRHGCDVPDECPESIRDMPLGEGEYIGHLDDLPGLLAELNAAHP